MKILQVNDFKTHPDYRNVRREKVCHMIEFSIPDLQSLYSLLETPCPPVNHHILYPVGSGPHLPTPSP